MREADASMLSAECFGRVVADCRDADQAPVPEAEKLPAKVYGVMAVTAALTFGTLMTTYELFFTRQLFA